MRLNFWQFRLVGHEQWLVQPNWPRRLFIRLFGPLGVHARIRNTRVINAVLNLHLPSNATILDAGCGHAYATIFLAKQFPDRNYIALDLDQQYIVDGERIKNYIKLNNLTFVNTDISKFGDNVLFDLIISIDLLEHLPDDLSALRSFRHALKPNGFLLLHLPRRHQEHRRIFPFFKKHTTADHVRDEYTAGEICKKLMKAGYQIDYLRYGFGLWGELSFELNYLYWDIPVLRIISALLFHPFSVFLAYLDTRREYEDGNSLLILAHPAMVEDNR